MYLEISSGVTRWDVVTDQINMSSRINTRFVVHKEGCFLLFLYSAAFWAMFSVRCIILFVYGRFHELSEFDDSKRSCRRRLAGHNERRRKNTTSETQGERLKPLQASRPRWEDSDEWRRKLHTHKRLRIRWDTAFPMKACSLSSVMLYGSDVAYRSLSMWHGNLPTVQLSSACCDIIME